MSYGVSGSAEVGAGALAGVAAGAVALAGLAVVGAGILVYRGIQACGKKIDENYQNACREWTALQEDARAEARARVRDIQAYMELEQRRLAAATSRLNQSGPTTQSVKDSVLGMRQHMEQASELEQARDHVERESARYRLRLAIEAGQGTLPRAALERAERALNEPGASMQGELDALEAEWRTVQDEQVQQRHQHAEAKRMLAEQRNRLIYLETVLRETPQLDQSLAGRSKVLLQEVADVRRRMDANATVSQTEVQALESRVSMLSNDVAQALNDDANTRRSQTAVALGHIDGLRQVLQDAQGPTGLMPAKVKEAFEAKLVPLQQRAEEIAGGRRPLAEMTRLSDDIQHLGTEIFGSVKTTQQQRLAQVIQQVLDEQGFSAGGKPTIKAKGDTVIVEGHKSSVAPESTSARHGVRFELSREGTVSADFSGYVGKACEQDAQAVFEALRQKGIYILDEDAQRAINSMPRDNVNADVLRDLSAHPEANTQQALLTERFLSVMREMGLPNLQVKMVGETVELESADYSVVLRKDGEKHVYTDRSHRLDREVTHNPNDPLMARVNASEPDQFDTIRTRPQIGRTAQKQ